MPDVQTGDPVAALKERHRAMWSAGDWPAVAPWVHQVSVRCLDTADPQPGERLLDVGCGDGPMCFMAAHRGVQVTGVDLAPPNIEAAKAKARKVGRDDIEFLVGDAEALPFEDGSFDVVVSALGAMFAPRHEVVAAELARVLRPGGRLAMCNWTPEGHTGQMFKLQGEYMPPPPAFASPPPKWGSEDHVRGLLEPHGLELSFARAENVLPFESLEDSVAEFERSFGPFLALRALIEPQGLYDGFRERLLALGERYAKTPGQGDIVQEYLVVSGRKTR